MWIPGRPTGAFLGFRLGVILGGLLIPGAGRAEIPPELGGHLIVSTASTAGFDPRLGLLSAGFARRGLESFVAHDVLRPSPDADELLAKGRRRLDEARRLRRKGKIDPAARAGAEALRLLEAGAQEQADLGLLVEALIERGATAMAEEDSATAETSFLRANALDPSLEPDRGLYGDEVIELFDEVRRVSRQLAYGQLRIDPAGIDAPEVVVDFGGHQGAALRVEVGRRSPLRVGDGAGAPAGRRADLDPLRTSAGVGAAAAPGGRSGGPG
ncbi:MAG: hypothetical protein IPG45_12655 [Deltaproteobacteria bacterium]|nr:hypothetical protein [Deltaproteobacteria bacterium]